MAQPQQQQPKQYTEEHKKQQQDRSSSRRWKAWMQMSARSFSPRTAVGHFMLQRRSARCKEKLSDEALAAEHLECLELLVLLLPMPLLLSLLLLPSHF